jgi:hypothetical protein
MTTRTILVCATCGKKIKAAERPAHNGHVITERTETLLSLRGLPEGMGQVQTSVVCRIQRASVRAR